MESFGTTRLVELKPNGGEISVTNENRDEFLALYTKYYLEDSIERQFQYVWWKNVSI